MKTLIILRGIPGCGKTTFAHFLEEELDGCLAFAADDYFTDIEGNYNWDSNKIWEAHAFCKRRVLSAMEIELPKIVVHNTNTTPKEMKDYYELASTHGYRVISLIVENRHGSTNVHKVPEEVLEKMKGRFDVKL
jgi:predicted kinase